MAYANYTPQEVESCGEDLYQRTIRSQVEMGNKGKFVVIDIETGDYEVDDKDSAASERILARRPNGVLYGVRIGYPTAYTLGGHTVPDKR